MDDRKESIVPVLRKPGTLPKACVIPVKVTGATTRARNECRNAQSDGVRIPARIPAPLADAGVNSDR
jgi:hypothetical protein